MICLTASGRSVFQSSLSLSSASHLSQNGLLPPRAFYPKKRNPKHKEPLSATLCVSLPMQLSHTALVGAEHGRQLDHGIYFTASPSP